MGRLRLDRRVGEEVIIGDDIRVIVTRAEHGKASLIFEAPNEIVIDRLEVRDENMKRRRK